jgi:hypothetical protein
MAINTAAILEKQNNAELAIAAIVAALQDLESRVAEIEST